MMVVLAIILALAGLLFVVMRPAKDSSLSTACLSNLGQIGKALSMYSADHDEFLPPQYLPGTDESVSPDVEYRPAEFVDGVLPYLGSRQVLFCPADKGKGKAGGASGFGSLFLSYAYSREAELANVEKAFKQSPTESLVTLPKDFSVRWSDIVRPSVSRLFQDRWTGPNTTHHGQAACYVFFDLHAKCMSFSQGWAHTREHFEGPEAGVLK
ncbi:MAG: hypothetical protein MH204_03165 [Fimbriimonadaceae bacterium]|nr:hypothetical protein [Fimbriimonadaceae bacterium]